MGLPSGNSNSPMLAGDANAHGRSVAHRDNEDVARPWVRWHSVFRSSTLGGNHFLEVCLDEREVVWMVLHSGSRGVGNRLADRHIKLARAQEQPLEDRDLAYFLEGTPEFSAYVAAEFAISRGQVIVGHHARGPENVAVVSESFSTGVG